MWKWPVSFRHKSSTRVIAYTSECSGYGAEFWIREKSKNQIKFKNIDPLKMRRYGNGGKQYDHRKLPQAKPCGSCKLGHSPGNYLTVRRKCLKYGNKRHFKAACRKRPKRLNEDKDQSDVFFFTWVWLTWATRTILMLELWKWMYVVSSLHSGLTQAMKHQWLLKQHTTPYQFKTAHPWGNREVQRNVRVYNSTQEEWLTFLFLCWIAVLTC